MIGIFSNLHGVIDMLAQVVFGLTIIATVLVRITPSEADNIFLGKVISSLHKVLAWLPTFGVNPNTKKLQEWVEENKEKAE